MRTLVCAAIMISLVGPWLPSVQGSYGPLSAHENIRNSDRYNGEWWLAADPEERSGFLEGASDCLTWTAHKPGFSGTSNQLSKQITHYYETHPKDKHLLVVQVWYKSQTRPKGSEHASGETWKNPHWYLNGLWWRQSSETEQTGFIEGYVWCMRYCVTQPFHLYSRTVEYYVSEITAYLNVHPKGDDEAIADILARYRDKQSNPKKAKAKTH